MVLIATSPLEGRRVLLLLLLIVGLCFIGGGEVEVEVIGELFLVIVGERGRVVLAFPALL